MSLKKTILFISLLLLPLIVNGKNIEIKGLSRLSFDDLQALTSIDLTSNKISNSELTVIVQELYEQDLIYDLILTEYEDRFVLELEENNLIQNIYFNNNSWVEDQILIESINSKQSSLISKTDISKDIEIINMIYKSKGFFDVTTIAKLETFSQDRVNLIFEIYEGKRSKLNSIKFKGNKTFSGRFLSSNINSQELSFYNIFKSGSNLNPDIFNFDQSKIENLYKDRGFFDVKVTYALEKGLLGNHSITFYIIEGDRYKIENINYSSDIPEEIFSDKFDKNFQNSLKKNEYFYDKKIINEHLKNINLLLSSNNIYDFYFDSEISYNDSSLNLEFIEVSQEPKIIKKIDIYGNAITKDKTIRSKFLLEPGDYLNDYLLKNSINNLQKFSYINEIRYEIDDTSNDYADLSFTIDEQKKTGNLLFAGTFNSDTELGFTLGIEDKNFGGSGNILDANFNINSEDVKFDLNYTQFPLTNPFLSNTYSIFNQENDYTSSFGYKALKQGFGYSLNFSDNSETRYGIGVSYEYAKGHSAKDTSVNAINDNIGEFENILFKFNAIKDTTNDLFNPNDGHYNGFSFFISPTEISDDPFFKLTYTNKNYFNLKDSENYIFFNNNFGYAESFRSKLKTINSFSLGGNNFKGFDFRGIGPVSNNIYLGGNQFLTSTLGYGSSFIFDEKDNINIKTFVTTGSIWNSDYTSDNEFELRSSAGISLDFITAIGPISFSYATPISKNVNDKERQFAFTIGTSF